MTQAELYGEDIAIDGDYQAVVAANGEAGLASGVDTLIQDLRLRLYTPLGSLFYDVTFGSLVHEFVKDENTVMNRMALSAEVARRIAMDPRVVVSSPACKVLKWDHEGIVLSASFRPIDAAHPLNLIISIAKNLADMVVKNVAPRL